MTHKILVAQGGGPTAVINQSLAGVVLEARQVPGTSPAFTARSTACAASSTRISST